MARRFSKIRQSPRLQEAYTQYKQWQDRVDPYNARPAGSRPGGFDIISVTPFGIDVTGKLKVQVSRRARTLMQSTIGSRATAPVAADQIRGGYIPAKVILFAGTGNSTTARSEITGQEYQKRSGASYTHAFGASTATEREYEAFQALFTAFVQDNINNSVSYSPERISVE